LLFAWRSGDRATEAHGISRLLRAFQGPRGSDARAVLRSVRLERMLPACAVDHGEGRFPVLAFVRRGCVWGTSMAGSGGDCTRGRIRAPGNRAGDAGYGWRASEAQFRTCQRPGGRASVG